MVVVALWCCTTWSIESISYACSKFIFCLGVDGLGVDSRRKQMSTKKCCKELQMWNWYPSWWLNQPIWKICSSKWESSPIFRVKKHLKPPPSTFLPFSRIMSVNTKFDSQKIPLCRKHPIKINLIVLAIGDDITQLCGDYPVYPPEV